MQVAFIEACISYDRLKSAAGAVKALGLVEEFPQVESMYRERSLERLMNKQQWAVALKFVGKDKDLQVRGFFGPRSRLPGVSLLLSGSLEVHLVSRLD